MHRRQTCRIISVEIDLRDHPNCTVLRRLERNLWGRLLELGEVWLNTAQATITLLLLLRLLYFIERVEWEQHLTPLPTTLPYTMHRLLV